MLFYDGRCFRPTSSSGRASSLFPFAVARSPPLVPRGPGALFVHLGKVTFPRSILVFFGGRELRTTQLKWSPSPITSKPRPRQAGGPQVALPVPPPPPQSWPPWLPLGGRGSRPRSRQGDGTGFRSRWPRSSGQEPRWRLRAGRGGGGGGNRRPGVWGVRRGMQESLRWGRTLRQGVFQ